MSLNEEQLQLIVIPARYFAQMELVEALAIVAADDRLSFIAKGLFVVVLAKGEPMNALSLITYCIEATPGYALSPNYTSSELAREVEKIFKVALTQLVNHGLVDLVPPPEEEING